MQINSKTGLLDAARQVCSPNCDPRPAGIEPDLIVIHNISLPPNEFGGSHIDALFCNHLPADEHPYFAAIHKMQVSAHLLIRRDGEIVQYVPFHQRAWHAGQSSYAGREGCNDFSIGIELEGADTTPYTDVQYERLTHIVEALLATYPGLSAERIAGHCDIAPGRKTDPGPAFDWGRLHNVVS
jgi:AmpD protein